MRDLQKQPFPARPVLFALTILLGLAALIPFGPARAADRQQIETFLEITGFDAALDSIRFSAESAPEMLGLDPGQFGADWQHLSRQVFDRDVMHEMAIEILSATLDDEMLGHAVGFYQSDLGQRLVIVENATHLDEDSDSRVGRGQELLTALTAAGNHRRVEVFDRMERAIDSAGTGLRALQEIQIRFLLTANASGIVRLRVDEQGLRALMKEQEEELAEALRDSSRAGSAWTYRDFSTDELDTYVEALNHPLMQKVYELLNAVQYEITANRFEVLAVKMADLHPGQDI